MMEKTIYFIGGSPCSGKSTIAEMFAREYGMYYFKVDDYLEKYMGLAADKGKPTCKKSINMKPDEIWMQRDILFAERVKEECKLSGIPCIVNDGTKTPIEIFGMVKELFGLSKKIKDKKDVNV